MAVFCGNSDTLIGGKLLIFSFLRLLALFKILICCILNFFRTLVFFIIFIRVESSEQIAQLRHTIYFLFILSLAFSSQIQISSFRMSLGIQIRSFFMHSVDLELSTRQIGGISE